MRHILYFAGYRMVVLRWNNNSFTGMAEFEPDEKGLAAFERLVLNEVNRPIKMLIDIIEEDFRLDSMPQLIGRDRQAMQQRMRNRYFRQYSHTYLKVQGRATTGRKENVVLLSALTNSKLFQPWLDVLERCKAPLEGIFSLPLVGEHLLKSLGAERQNALIISQQIPSSIRQSFYANGQLKLSRLASADDAGTWHESLREETMRTVRYLENQTYADSENKLQVYIIAPGSDHEKIADVLRSDTQKDIHLIDKDRLAFELGIKNVIPGRFCYWIYSHIMMANQRLKPHYSIHRDRRYFYHYQAQRGLKAMAIGILSISIFWSLLMLWEGFSLQNKRQSTIAETAKFNRLYDDIMSDISKLNLKIDNVRAAVDVAEDIVERTDSTPLKYMQLVSKALKSHPRVQLNNYRWISTADSSHSFGESKKPLDRRVLRLIQAGRKSFQYEKALVNAEVSDFQTNPRIAVEEAESFVAKMQSLADDVQIEIIKMPFDVDPASRMVGQSLSQAGRQKDNPAEFAFVISRESEF